MDHPDENDLVRSLRPTVEVIARRLAKRSPVPLADAIASGMYGALQAVRSFDPSKGWKLTTYAAPRIRGQILDDLRAQMISRNRTERVARALERQQQLMHEQGRDVPLDDLLDEETRAFNRFSAQQSLATVVRGGDGRARSYESLVADPASERRRQQHQDQIGILVESLLKPLRGNEREIIRLYFDGLTMHAIADQVGCSESRISQLMAAALGRMRFLGEQQDQRENGMDVEQDLRRTRDNLEALKIEVERRLRSIESDINILKRINARQGAIDREAHSEAARSEPRDECRAGETAAERSDDSRTAALLEALTKAVRLLAADKDACNERLDQLEERIHARTIQSDDDRQAAREAENADGGDRQGGQEPRSPQADLACPASGQPSGDGSGPHEK